MKTGRTIQRGMFAESLSRQLDVMSLAARKNELSKTAEEYLEQGMSADETVELLTIDGYDTTMAKSCVSMILGSMGKVAKEIPEWGFEAEDQDGKVYSNFDNDVVIVAGTKAEALQKAKTIVEDQAIDKVTKVFRLE